MLQDRGSIIIPRLELGPANAWCWTVPDGVNEIVIEHLLVHPHPAAVHGPSHMHTSPHPEKKLPTPTLRLARKPSYNLHVLRAQLAQSLRIEGVGRDGHPGADGPHGLNGMADSVATLNGKPGQRGGAGTQAGPGPDITVIADRIELLGASSANLVIASYGGRGGKGGKGGNGGAGAAQHPHYGHDGPGGDGGPGGQSGVGGTIVLRATLDQRILHNLCSETPDAGSPGPGGKGSPPGSEGPQGAKGGPTDKSDATIQYL